MADETDKVEPSAPTCLADPNFAVICSFMDKFAASIGITVLPFTQLQEMLEDQDQVSQALIDLHVKLLRKARKSFTVDKWEKALTKFAHTYAQQDGWELERFGYKKASLGVKLRLLKTLLEAQFDVNVRFKNDVNKLVPQELRVEPLGKDGEGLTYWCQFDPACNVRVYREDVDEETWDLVAQDRNGLVKLIDSLSSGEGQQELSLILEEEANQESEKPVTDTGQEENDGTAEDDSEEIEEEQETEAESGEENEEESDELDGEESMKGEESVENSVQEQVERGNSKEPEKVGEQLVVEQPVVVETRKDAEPPQENPQDFSALHGKSEVLNKTAPSKGAEPYAAPKVLPDVKPTHDTPAQSAKQEKKEPVSCAPLNIPTRPQLTKPGQRPGSKLEEIFKMKLDRPTYAYPDDKTSILSQMAARFNNDNEVEDLSTSRKKPRLDNVVNKLAEASTLKSEPVVGEAIEEKVMVVAGEGSGAECNAGNPSAEQEPDSTLEVVGVINGSNETSVREALRNCILNDSSTNASPREKSPGRRDSSDDRSAVEAQFDLLERIRLISSSANLKCEALSPADPLPKDFVFEASEVIEEEVMYFTGCGAGHGCNTGNPDEPTGAEPSTSDEPEKKTTKKLWSIDTICKTSDDNRSVAGSTTEDENRSNGPDAGKPEIEKNEVGPTEKLDSGVENGRKEGEPEKGKSTGEKTVMLTNLIEHCLKNNSAGDESPSGKGPPSGTSYQDLFSAKNIDGPMVTKTDEKSGEEKEPGIEKPDEVVSESKSKKSDKIEKPSSAIPKKLSLGEQYENEPSGKKPDEACGESSAEKSDVKDESSSEKCGNPVKSSKTPQDASTVKNSEAPVKEVGPSKADDPVKEPAADSKKETSANKLTKEASVRKLGDSALVSSEKKSCKQEGLSTAKKSDKPEKEPAAQKTGRGEKEPIARKADEVEPMLKKPARPRRASNATESADKSSGNLERLGKGSVKGSDMVESRSIKSGLLDKETSSKMPEKSINPVEADKEMTKKSNELAEAPKKLEKAGKELTKKELEAKSSQNPGNLEKEPAEKSSEVESTLKKPDKSSKESSKKVPEKKLADPSEPEREPAKSSDEVVSSLKTREKPGKASTSKGSDLKSIQSSADLGKEPSKKSNEVKSMTKKSDKPSKESRNKVVTNPEESEGESAKSSNEVATRMKPSKELTAKRPETESTSNPVESDEEPGEEACKVESSLKKHGKPSKDSSRKGSEKKSNNSHASDRTRSPDEVASTPQTHEKPRRESIAKECEEKSCQDKTEGLDKAGKGSVSASNVSGGASEEDCDGNTGKVKSEKIKDEEEVKVSAEIKLEPNVKIEDDKEETVSIKTETSSTSIKKENPKDVVEGTNKPKGRKSRTNSLNVEEVPSKVRKTDEDLTPKEVPGRRATRQTRNSSLRVSEEAKKVPVKGKSGQSKEAKALTLAAFSLEEPLDDPPSKVTKTKAEHVAKGGKRKRGVAGAAKSEEDGTEEDDAKAEQDEEVGGKKPRLRAKVKKGGKRQAGKGGSKPTKEVSKDESEEEGDASNLATETRTELKGGKSDEDEDDVPLAKRGRPREKAVVEANKKESSTPSSRKSAPRQRTLLGLTETDIKPILTPEGGGRASRRIAMQKIKEEAERRAVEEALKDIDKGGKKKKNKDKTFKASKDVSSGKKERQDKKDNLGGRNKKKQKQETEEEDEEADDDKKKRKRKSKGFKYNINRPWASSSGSSDENVEEEEEDFMGLEEEEDVRGKVVSDHEFSCDEDLEKGEGEAEPVRRARTAIRKDKSEKPPEGVQEKTEEEDDAEDYKCEKCGSGDHPEWILLCDTCDKGYHASCLRPPLMLIPEGDWHCPVCQHANLVKKLKEVLRTFEKNTKRRDNEELRRKRLAYVGISLANVLPDSAGSKVKKEKRRIGSDSEESDDRSGSSSEDSDSGSTDDSDDEPVYQLRQRRSAAQNYRFNEYDQLIDSAIQDEMVAAATVPSAAYVPPAVSLVAPGVASEGQEGIENAEVPAENGVIADNKADGEKEALDGDGEKVAEGKEEGEEQDEEGDISKGWRPPVVPRKPKVPFSGRKKPKKLCNLDVESDDQNDSDEDFKGSSSDDEEDDFSGGSDESGDWSRRRQPLRRSGRARQSRVDRDFIADDSDDSSGPRSKKKKRRQEWDESDSSSSDRSWGRRKKKNTTRSSFSKSKSKKSKSRKSKKYDSDSDAPKKKPKPKKPKARVRYGLSEDDDDDGPLIRTRGKKMNYTEIHGSDTEEEERINRIKGRKTLSDMEAEDEEFVLDKEEEEEFMGGKSLIRKGPRRISSDSEDHSDDGKPDGNAASEKDAVEEPKEVEADKPKPEEDKPAPAPSRPLPPASQPLPASRPKPCPLSKKPKPIIESEDEQIEEAEDEEEDLIDEEEPPEDDDSEEEDELDEEPPRRIPPPVPSLKAIVPGQPPPDPAKSGPLSKLKEALSAGERKPKESEALARLREKLANAAARPHNAPPPAPPQPDVDPLKEKPSSPPPAQPVVNSIRVVNTAKLLAQPVQEALKRQEESVMRGMLGGHPLPHGPPSMYSRMYPPRRMMTPAMDPRFMQRPPFLPSTHPMHHQQRRFPDRYMYGPGGPGGFHGGYFAPAPGPAPFPPQEIRPVPASDFSDGPLPPSDDDPPPFPGTAPPKTEGPGEFGGLVSYFSSQREEEADLDT